MSEEEYFAGAARGEELHVLLALDQLEPALFLSSTPPVTAGSYLIRGPSRGQGVARGPTDDAGEIGLEGGVVVGNLVTYGLLYRRLQLRGPTYTLRGLELFEHRLAKSAAMEVRINLIEDKRGVGCSR